MPLVDFTPFGYNSTLDLEGDILFQRVGEKPLVFLFDEDHGSVSGIVASLRNALKLINAFVVDFVGVEETPEGVREKADELARRKYRYESLEAYSASLHAHFDSDEAAILEAANKKRELIFGQTLLFIRPTIKIHSVDDVELCKVAQAEHDRLLEVHDTETPEGKRAARREFSKHDVHRQRDRIFAERLFQFYRECGASRAAILNAGGNHNERIVSILPNDISIIRIRPPGYVDRSAE